MGTRLGWKHLEESIRLRIEVLERITQGSLLLDLTGVTGVYQLTEEESKNTVVSIFCFDETPQVTGVALYDSPSNPVKYTLFSCLPEGYELDFIAGVLMTGPIKMQSGAVTEVVYGFSMAFEELIQKLGPMSHGDIIVEPDLTTWTIGSNTVSADKLSQAVVDDIASRLPIADLENAVNSILVAHGLIPP